MGNHHSTTKNNRSRKKSNSSHHTDIGELTPKTRKKFSTASDPTTRKTSTHSYSTNLRNDQTDSFNQHRAFTGDNISVGNCSVKKRLTVQGSQESRDSPELVNRRARYKDIRYQSVRGTCSEPKLLRANRVHASSSSVNSSRKSLVSASKQEGVDDDFEKMKLSKKLRRINMIKSARTDLWDHYEIGGREKLEFALHPKFENGNTESTTTYHSLAVNFLKIPDEKIEERQQLYDFEVTFTEAKFNLEKMSSSTSNKLVRGHTFYGLSRYVKVTEDDALIVGNFYNPEYGKMDFFTFELSLLPAHHRYLDIPDIENINNETNLSSISRQGYRNNETRWGTFFMKVRGSYKSKEFLFTVVETENPFVQPTTVKSE